MTGAGSGCECIGGCWSCGTDTCWRPGSDAGSDGSDASGAGDAAEPADDGSVDAGGVSLDAATDTTPPAPDAAPPDAGPPDAGPPDAGVPATETYCVDIDVSNTCVMTVTPTEITIPADQTAYFCWRNRSRDYPVDVWLSYGGGYTDLAPGATWNEPPGHCLGPLVHDEYADISTACSSFRFLIHCL